MIFLHWISNLDIYYWIAGRDKSRVFQSIFRHDSAFYKCYVSSRVEVRPRPPPPLRSQNTFTEFRFLKMLQKPSSPLIGQSRHSPPLIGQHMDHQLYDFWECKGHEGNWGLIITTISWEIKPRRGKCWENANTRDGVTLTLALYRVLAAWSPLSYFLTGAKKTCADDDGSDVPDAPSETEWSSVYC